MNYALQGNLLLFAHTKNYSTQKPHLTDDVELRPCAIVLDDAHAGIENIRDSFTIKIPNGSDSYNRLFSIFKQSCEAYSPHDWGDIENKDRDRTFEVPFWIWAKNHREVHQELTSYKENDELRFVWEDLREHLRWCRCVFGYEGLEISSILPLIEKKLHIMIVNIDYLCLPLFLMTHP